MLIGTISHAKNEMLTPEEFRLQADGDFQQKKIADVYEEYEKQLRANNALDFDCCLCKYFLKIQNITDICPTEFINRLIIISDYTQILIPGSKQTYQLKLHPVRILILIYHNIAESLLIIFQHIALCLE